MRQMLVGLVLALVASSVRTEPQPQGDWCSSRNASNEQKITGCTVKIQSGGEAGRALAEDYDSRGAAYVARGQVEEGVADYSQAIALNPNDAIAYKDRGGAYRAKGLYDQAVADYSQAIALTPSDAGAYVGRGDVYKAKGVYDQAIADYTHAIALYPSYPMAFGDRGSAYEAKGLRDQAIADYRAALNLSPNMKAALDGLIRLGVTP